MHSTSLKGSFSSLMLWNKGVDIFKLESKIPRRKERQHLIHKPVGYFNYDRRKSKGGKAKMQNFADSRVEQHQS